jgi:aminopeptidase N
MAYNFVGKAAFKKGLRLYFERFAYQNTKGNDLWQALEDASGKQVKSFMNAWIEQSGFPLVSVTQNGDSLALKQQQFAESKLPAGEKTWPVPLAIRPKQESLELFSKSEKTYKLGSSRFVRLNADGAHYSVRYESPEHRAYLKDLIQNGKIAPAERLFMLNDSLMQARSGQGSIAETMDILEALENEQEDPVWGVMSLCMSDARTLVESNKKLEDKMKQFAWQLVKSHYEELGWEKRPDEPINVTKLRGIILGLATYSEEPHVIAEVIAQYKRYDSLEQIPADTRHIIMTGALRHGGNDIFEALMAAYPTIGNSELQQDVCNALASTKDVEAAKSILAKLKDPSFVRLQDFDRWIIFLLRNRKARTNTWNWFTNNWTWIEENFGSDKSYDNYPRYAGRVFSTQKWLDKYIAFFEPLKTEVSLKRNIELGIEEIGARIVWRERDEQALKDWLGSRFS